MQVIDPVCGRHTAILDDNMVALDLTDSDLPDEPEIIIIDRHKKFPGAGKKATTKFKVMDLKQCLVSSKVTAVFVFIFEKDHICLCCLAREFLVQAKMQPPSSRYGHQTC